MRRTGILVIAALGALILGFLARRTMIPSAVHYIAYRAPDRPQAISQAGPPAASPAQSKADDSAAAKAKSNADAGAGAEQLTPGDRSELDAILKRKTK
jgi:hypothetical protein